HSFPPSSARPDLTGNQIFSGRLGLGAQASGFEPLNTAGRKLRGKLPFVEGEAVRPEQTLPAAIDPLVEEALSAPDEHRHEIRRELVAFLFHGFKLCSLHEAGP